MRLSVLQRCERSEWFTQSEQRRQCVAGCRVVAYAGASDMGANECNESPGIG